MKVKAPFYCQQMISEDSGVIAKYALQGERLVFIGWVNDGSWDLIPDDIDQGEAEKEGRT